MRATTTPFLLTHERYWSPADYRDEMRVVEKSLWNMAGLTIDIPNDNDYLTVSVGEKSVIVQNFKGRIRAFDNVCAHRFCRIRSVEKGNGPLRCPYHSWLYNEDGKPVGIPHKDMCFEFDEATRASVSLNSWQVELCGSFIFIRGDAKGPDIKVSLGNTYAEVEQLSNSLGREVDTFVCEYGANWKVCVENTLDEYHAQFVHPTTFRSMLAGDFAYSYEGRQSKMDARINDESLEKWRRVAKHFEARPIKTDTYFHYVVFPLLTLASTFGVSFSVQTFRPLSPSRTLLTSRLFLTRFENAKAPRAVEEALGFSAREFNRTVFLEDKFVCEQVQQGLQQGTSSPGILGKYEQRLGHFQKCAVETFAYKDRIPGDAS